MVTPERPGAGIARIEGWDPEAHAGAGGWIPYPAMLLKLAAKAESPADEVEGGSSMEGGSRWKDMAAQRRATEEWFQKVQVSLRGTPTLLIAQAQNARSHWTWLQDGNVQIDRIRTGHAPSRRIDPDLRLLRVRTGLGRETAQWWGVNTKEGQPNGIPAHLWTTACNRVFYSTMPKPSQFTSTAVVDDKLGGRTRPNGEIKLDTGKPSWNPDLVEFAVLGCHEKEGDAPEALALTAHKLRQPPDYPQALSLPLPLHLAELAQEYVMPLDIEDEGQTD
jgi:hypothetical protein